jgi:predicted enzyme related to lactoylglutathione lyase
MRIKLVEILLCLAVATTGVAADIHKPPKPDVGAGHIAWFDISTTDLPKAKDFYGKLFGWTFNPVDGTNLAVEIVAGGTEIGTLRKAEGAISAFNGVVYVQVKDMRAACAKATALGGKVVEGFPFDLSGEQGSVGLVLDTSGHPFGLYSRTPLAAQKTK